MTRHVAVEAVLQHTTLQPAEAVAILQQLIHAPAPTSLTEPFGPPTAATVFVGTDGSVTCTTCDAPPVVSELAALLDAMLPPGGTSPIVPGGLRYIVARARMEVDAPPFDSVFEFSQALARHERGDRSAVILSALARVKAQGPDDWLERRRTGSRGHAFASSASRCGRACVRPAARDRHAERDEYAAARRQPRGCAGCRSSDWIDVHRCGRVDGPPRCRDKSTSGECFERAEPASRGCCAACAACAAARYSARGACR